jgi:diacylglycerol kinase family enzyme
VVEAARQSGLRFDVRELSAEAMAGAIQQLAKDGVRRVAVAGGDGTIALAAGAASSSSIELAVVPGGTLNHLASDMGIPDALDEALHLAINGEARPVDAGCVNDRIFLNTSSVGAYVTFVRTRERLERSLGYRLASIVAGIRLLIRPPVFTVEVEIEGKMRVDVTPLVFVGVAERELRLPTLGGRAEGGRRGLHLMIVRGRSRARLAALAFAAAARGTRSATRSPTLDAFVVSHFTIRMRRRRRRVATDGELHMMFAPLEFAWLPDAVKIVSPR